MGDHMEQRPGLGSEALSLSLVDDTTMVPTGRDLIADLDTYAEHLRGYLAVQVQVDDDGHRRTTLYRSAAAAQRAVERAHSRGRWVHTTLVTLMPVGVVSDLTGPSPLRGGE